MKNIKLFITLIALLVILPISVSADEVEITGDSVGIRRTPKVDSDNLIIRVNSGVKYRLLSGDKFKDQSTTSNNCSSNWYKIDYQGMESYVCSEYTRVIKSEVVNVDTSSCQAELTSKGFPKEYVDKLCVLKAKYPNWVFTPVQTGLDFDTAVNSESACGKNTISTSIAEYKDLSCSGNYDSGYVSASQKAVAYYLNPLNFLDDVHIFMFESAYVNNNIPDDVYSVVTPKILGSFMTTNLPSLTTALNLASREKNVSQVILSARIKQEIGSGKATTGAYAGGLLSCICGKYTTRWGTTLNGESMDNYYNFFNVGVYDGSNGDAPYRAVRYAKLNNWGGTGDQTTDLKLAIGGGAEFLKNGYLNAGQDTMYFQKFNVHPVKSNNLYIHQYMSNIQAPVSEAEIVHGAYYGVNALSNTFEFLIPVYNNIGATIINTDNGASGDAGENQPSGIDVMNIVRQNYKLSDNVITGVAVGSTLDDFKNKIASLGGTVVGNPTGLIRTGLKVTVSNGSVQKEFVFVVKGDTSGDGQINALDLLQVQKKILNQYNMNNEAANAGDTSGDGQINALDLLQIQKSILGQYTIAQ